MSFRGSRSQERKVLRLLQRTVPRCDVHGGDAQADAVLRSKSAYPLCPYLHVGSARLPPACRFGGEDLPRWVKFCRIITTSHGKAVSSSLSDAEKPKICTFIIRLQQKVLVFTNGKAINTNSYKMPRCCFFLDSACVKCQEAFKVKYCYIWKKLSWKCISSTIQAYPSLIQV